MRLDWTDPAQDDLDHIEGHIKADKGPLVAIDVVLNVLDVVELLADQPYSGREGRVKNTREHAIDGLPFIIVYRPVDALDTLQILRVLHEAQRWPSSH